jgi:hypothetical protein
MNEALLSSPEINEFWTSVPLQVALKEELQQPGIKAALAAIASTVLPRNIPPSIPGNHPDTAIAHQFYRMFGVQQVLSTLEAMALPKGRHRLSNGAQPLTEFEGSLPAEYADPRPPDQREK